MEDEIRKDDMKEKERPKRKKVSTTTFEPNPAGAG